jgi:hypothetical protein
MTSQARRPIDLAQSTSKHDMIHYRVVVLDYVRSKRGREGNLHVTDDVIYYITDDVIHDVSDDVTSARSTRRWQHGRAESTRWSIKQTNITQDDVDDIADDLTDDVIGTPATRPCSLDQ